MICANSVRSLLLNCTNKFEWSSRVLWAVRVYSRATPHLYGVVVPVYMCLKLIFVRISLDNLFYTMQLHSVAAEFIYSSSVCLVLSLCFGARPPARWFWRLFGIRTIWYLCEYQLPNITFSSVHTFCILYFRNPLLKLACILAVYYTGCGGGHYTLIVVLYLRRVLAPARLFWRPTVDGNQNMASLTKKPHECAFCDKPYYTATPRILVDQVFAVVWHSAFWR